MPHKIRILSTKKLLPNQKQYLLNADFSVLEADFITIRNMKFELGTTAENLIFTSQNAFKSFLENADSSGLKDRKVFCVGLKTKALIEQHGFRVILFSDYAEELARILTTLYADEGFTFFSGSMRRETLPMALRNANISFNEVQIYETTLSPSKIDSRLDGILFFSPSGVESYLQRNTITHETCFCIGTTTAKALKGITENIINANQPTIENVIIQAIKKYN